MGLPALRALCGKFSDAKVLTKDHALELIEDYKASLKVKI
jgi:hypothetical protein